MKTYLKHFFSIVLIFVVSRAFAGVEVCFQYETLDNDWWSVEMRLSSQEALLGLQFSLGWDALALEFEEITDVNEELLGLDLRYLPEHMGLPASSAMIPINRLTFVWTSPGLDPKEFQEEVLFTMRFKVRPNTFPRVTLERDPTEIHFVNVAEEELPFVGGRCEERTAALIGGSVKLFLDEYCSDLYEDPPYNNWLVKASSGSREIYGNVRASGNYTLFLEPGQYTIEVVSKGGYGQLCDGETSVLIEDPRENVDLDLIAAVERDCPVLRVDLHAEDLGTGGREPYYCSIANYGTRTAEQVYVEIQFDSIFENISPTWWPWIPLGDGRYQFELGDLEPGTEHGILIWVERLEQMRESSDFCNEAIIYTAAGNQGIPLDCSGDLSATDMDCTNSIPAKKHSLPGRFFTDGDTGRSRSISLYPNPATSFVSLDILETNDLPLIFEMYDNNGRIVLKKLILNQTDPISIAELPAGLYTYRFTGKGKLPETGKLSVL